MDRIIEIYRSITRQEEVKLLVFLKTQFMAGAVPLQLHADICHYRDVETLQQLLQRRHRKYKTLAALKKAATLLKKAVEKFIIQDLIEYRQTQNDIDLLNFFQERNADKNYYALNEAVQKQWHKYSYEQKIVARKLEVEIIAYQLRGDTLSDEFVEKLKQLNYLFDEYYLENKLKEICMYNMYKNYRTMYPVHSSELLLANEFPHNKTIQLLTLIADLQQTTTKEKALYVLRYFDENFKDIRAEELNWVLFLAGNTIVRHIILHQEPIHNSLHLAFHRFLYKRFFDRERKRLLVHPLQYRNIFTTALQSGDQEWINAMLTTDLALLPLSDRSYMKTQCLSLKHYYDKNYPALWKAALSIKPRIEYDKAMVKGYQMICLYEAGAFDTLYDNIRSERIRLKRDKNLAVGKETFVKFLDTLSYLLANPSLTSSEKQAIVKQLNTGVKSFAHKWLLEKFGHKE